MIVFYVLVCVCLLAIGAAWTVPPVRRAIKAMRAVDRLTAKKPSGTRGKIAEAMYEAALGKELALPQAPVKSYESFGHPAPPILLLSTALPSAPIGYGWEITTVTNAADNPALRLAMLDLASTVVVDAIEADLVVVRRWRYAADDTYADFYRRAEAGAKSEITGYARDPMDHYSAFRGNMTPIYGKDPTELQGKVMMANLITPMVDWARLITLRYIVEHPDETKCNYVLIESEGASH